MVAPGCASKTVQKPARSPKITSDKIIFIEQHFKPTCTRITSTIHSAKSELGNVEFFELCETIPKVQCSHCLLFCWNQGIVYCTCGPCLIHSESRKFSQTKTGCTLYPGLRDKERRHPWCSTRQDRGKKRIPHGLECVEEML